MLIESIRQFVKDKAEQFGAKTDNEYTKSYIERNNTKPDSLKDNGAYFGLIHPEEEVSGPYHDFSLTIFPDNENRPWLICLGVGSLGFKNDFELSSYPGLRRLFSKLVDDRGFCKTDFSDIETSLPRTLTGSDTLQHIKRTIKTYSKVLPACQIVDDPSSEEGKRTIAAFVAAYAKLREWPTNKQHRKAVSEALQPFLKSETNNYFKQLEELVETRKFVILQGAPGTGKTRAARKVSEALRAVNFFTQFHAETTYSDFIHGIRPDLSSDQLKYVEKKGVFSEAVIYAIQNPNQKVILTIDEINRANLSNVLGPIFYLFEYKRSNTEIQIEIFPGMKITNLPKNFYVIATMNTADRSLAVIDFALRRRFAWFELRPMPLKGKKQKLQENTVFELDDEDVFFFIEDFSAINEIFYWFASSNELSLQPGQGYFIANSVEEMTSRIKYEVFPLIKEYLQEGLLQNAKEEFNNYFSNRISASLFE